MRVVRVLIYEGDVEAVTKQLGQSMGDGTRPGMGNSTITCFTIEGFTLQIVEQTIRKVCADTTNVETT
jgi:hypothetical protein